MAKLIPLVPLLTGLLLAYAGFLKMVHPADSVLSLESLGSPRLVAELLIGTICAVELYLAFCLWLHPKDRANIMVTMCVFFLFTTYLTYLGTLADPPSCGCMGLTGVFESNKKNALVGAARNAILLLFLHWYLQRIISDPIQGNSHRD